MKQYRLIIFFSIVLLGCKNSTPNKSEKITTTRTSAKPIVSFTFDDGVTLDLANIKFEEWNEMILLHLENEKVKAVLFVAGKDISGEKGQILLQSWKDRGHKIGNHSFTHPNFNSEKSTSHLFENELKRTDTIISKFSNAPKLFRFPYLKEGQNKFKVDSIRNILSQNNYLNAHVTIDGSDWSINQLLTEKVEAVGIKKKEIEKYKDFYIQNVIERANYYEKLSYEMNERHISHTVLLHHNLASALFLGDLIAKFKENGWEVRNADEAYQDQIYQRKIDSDFAGESLIYSIAKQSGEYEQSLRSLAEESRMEKEKISKLEL